VTGAIAIRVTLAFGVLLAIVACSKAPAVSETPVNPAAAQTTGHKTAPPPPFCIVALQIDSQLPKFEGFPTAALERELRKVLREGEPKAVFATQLAPTEAATHSIDCQATAPAAAKVGVLIRASAAVMDSEGKVVAPSAAKKRTELAVSVALHVERGGVGGRPEIGVSDVTAAVPFRHREPALAQEFVRIRLARAVEIAAADAFGQLVVRSVPDEALLQMLDAPQHWRRVAALREVGERGLTGGLKAAEHAALDSRKDLALVAIGTLGRLGDRRSLAVLRKALDARAAEVIDAALTAIADIGGDEGRATIDEVARTHPSQWIRRRAEHLLEPRRGK
jgi:hypothetical protein